MDLLDRLRLDVPVAQAGIGGGRAGPELAAAALYAGETVLRMTSVIPARQAVTELAPR